MMASLGSGGASAILGAWVASKLLGELFDSLRQTANLLCEFGQRQIVMSAPSGQRANVSDTRFRSNGRNPALNQGFRRRQTKDGGYLSALSGLAGVGFALAKAAAFF